MLERLERLDLDDPERRRAAVRAVLLIAMFASSGYILVVMASPTSADAEGVAINRVDLDEQLGDRVGDVVADPAPGITVITAQGAAHWSYSADLIALDADGRLLYHNGTYDIYYDVDPHPTGELDVLYVGHEDREDGVGCPNGWGSCSVNNVEVVNLSTGEVDRIYAHITPNTGHSRWHDVDRINETHYVVAGIEYDRVLVVDVEADEVVWQWNASDYYPPPSKSGGPADDWTHLNDVEVLPDGRIMASPRNHDQVIAIWPNGTVDESFTLGADGRTSVLYEQHQPDYIPPELGGPALLVADSENDRIVEYQREAGAWNRTWRWSDDRLNWPRDADRLPNGHTLVTDSYGHRVAEVDRAGRVVWSVDVGMVYEAERLGTGDESVGGPSAARAGLWSRTGEHSLPAFIPAKVRHGLLFLLPPWLTLSLSLAIVVYVASTVVFLYLVLPGAYDRAVELVDEVQADPTGK